MWRRLPRDPSQGPCRDRTRRLRPLAWTPGAFLPLNHRQPLAAARPSAQASSERPTPLAKSTASLKPGLPQAVADDLKVGKRPASMQADEAAVYDLCMDLAKDHVVSDATFKKARELFSDQQIVDLITVSGVYITLPTLSNTAEDATPGGKTPPLQPLA